jgi:hypothetical protein
MIDVKGLQNLLEENILLQQNVAEETCKIRQLLTPFCDHSKTEDYKWEWDSGYGRQTKKVGKRCSYCLRIDLWNRGNFLDPTEIGT